MTIGLNQLVNLNDQQLYQMAEYQTAIGADKSKLANNSVLYGIPLIDSFSRAALNQGTLGDKAMVFGQRMTGWAGFFVLASLYNNALDSLKNNVPAVRDFEQKHPALSTVLNIMGLWVAMDYAYKGVKYIGNKLIQKYPDKTEILREQHQNIFKKLDNSWVDNKLYKPLQKGMQYLECNFPAVTKGLKAVVPWVAPLMVAGAFTKSLCMVNSMKNTTQNNYERLKQLQAQIKEKIY